MSARPVKTVFYRHDRAPVVNSACDPDRAAGQAVVHMRSNKYNAHSCEVYNIDTGLDVISARWTKAGELILIDKTGDAHPVDLTQ